MGIATERISQMEIPQRSEGWRYLRMEIHTSEVGRRGYFRDPLEVLGDSGCGERIRGSNYSLTI